MLQLTEKNLSDFKSLYKKHFWVELREEDVLNNALSLVNFARIILHSKHEDVWKK